MIAKCIVYTGKHGPFHSIEKIVCFDYCIFCGEHRIKQNGSVCKTKKGKIIADHVYCSCDPYILHDELNEEFKIIHLLNEFGILTDIEI